MRARNAREEQRGHGDPRCSGHAAVRAKLVHRRGWPSQTELATGTRRAGWARWPADRSGPGAAREVEQSTRNSVRGLSQCRIAGGAGAGREHRAGSARRWSSATRRHDLELGGVRRGGSRPGAHAGDPIDKQGRAGARQDGRGHAGAASRHMATQRLAVQRRQRGVRR
ncbi:hypothetical protein ZWY2020_034523 [Hordeum vulgare]|nr:hypothetical protein ZWY2020_034523 [Hordeum vulgare]